MNRYLLFNIKLFTISVLCLFFTGVSQAQIVLTGTEYFQNFNTLGSSGLPEGWTVYTGANATLLGNPQSFGTAHVNWNNTGGAFKNFAASPGPDQSTTENRALGVRQTGSFGDPGAAFVFQISNTTGLENFQLSFKLMSLDAASPRRSSWIVQYGTLSDGTYTFSTAGGPYYTGNNTSGSNEFTVNFDNALDDLDEPVWIRIVTLTGTDVNTGSRASTAIDDFRLTYSEIDPTAASINTSPASLSDFTYATGNGPSAPQSYTISAANLEPDNGNIDITAPSGYEIGLNETGSFSESLAITYSGGLLDSKTIYVRLKEGLSPGDYANQQLLHSISGTSISTEVSLSGSVTDPTQPCNAVSIPVSSARAATAGTVVTITGRITALTLANNNIYLKDGDGADDGILLFDNSSLRPEDLQVGDEVQVTGTRAVFNQMVQLANLTCFKRTATVPTTPEPTVISGSNLAAYEGQLVALSDVSINTTAQKFAGNTTYTLSDGSILYIHNNSAIGGGTIPEGQITITGIVTLFQGNAQLTPRFIDDIPGTTPPAPCGLSLSEVTNDEKQLEVVNWNVEWLGHSSNGTGASQLNNVITGIRTMQADVYMLQEVCSYNTSNPNDPSTAFGAIIQALNNEYPTRNYSGECSPAYSYSYETSPDPQGQRVCFVYRTDQIAKVSSKPLMQEIYNGGVANYPTGNSSQFWSSGRLPFLLEADVTLNNQTTRMHFITLHSKANTNPQDMSYERRKYDHREFYYYLNSEYPDASIIMAGDFNDDFDQSIFNYGSQNISSWSPFLYTNPSETNINGSRPNENWHALTYKFSGTGCSSSQGFSTFIDHVMVSNEISHTLPSARTSAGDLFSVSDIETVRGTIASGSGRASDHFPTFTRYAPASALPVVLSDFKVREDKESLSIKLEWATASEEMSSHFEVERSSDGKSFHHIGSVTSRNNSFNGPALYNFTDRSPLDGISYYRLKMVDLDGSFEYSRTLSANVEPVFEVFPNPVSETAQINGLSGFSSWSLFDLTGSKVLVGTDRVVKLSNLATGLYILRIELGSGAVLSRRILKQ